MSLVLDDAVAMPAELTPAMEQVWRNAFLTQARRRSKCGPRNREKVMAEGSAEQAAYRALVKYVRKHGGFPP